MFVSKLELAPTHTLVYGHPWLLSHCNGTVGYCNRDHMISKVRIQGILALYRSLWTPEPDRPKDGHAAFRALYVFLSKAPHTSLFVLAQTPPPLNRPLLHFPIYNPFGMLVITVGFVFCSSLCILQHVKQYPAHNRCIIHTYITELVWNTVTGIREGRELTLGREGQKDFVEVWGQDHA